MEAKVKDVRKTKKDHLDTQKKAINQGINSIYNEICKNVFQLDKYRIPIHGIPHP